MNLKFKYLLNNSINYTLLFLKLDYTILKNLEKKSQTNKILYTYLKSHRAL